jgi:hypothetical protein
MNVEIGAEAAQFPEKEYINGIFVADTGRYRYYHMENWGLAEHVIVHNL